MTFRIEQIDSNKLIVFWHHYRQTRFIIVARANVCDGLDGFLPAWGHQKVDFEGDPVGVDGASGGEQSQRQQVMESAGNALAFSIQPGRRFDIAMEDGAGNDRVEFETDRFRLLRDIDQYAVRNRLCP